jgi:hypothetical protein
MSSDTFYGLRIIESVHLVQDGEPYEVRRSWRDRLFTRPWRPLVRTRTVVPKVPYRGALGINSHTVAMHPETARRLRDGAR